MNYIMRAWDDWHSHFREPGPRELMACVLGFTTAWCDRALAMPNRNPICVATGDQARVYEDAICAHSPDQCFRPKMSIKLLSRTAPGKTKAGPMVWTTPEVIREARALGVLAAKGYPVGEEGTTGAQLEGVDIPRIEDMFPNLEAMQDVDMVSCWHCEVPGVDGQRAEQEFLPIAQRIIETFPGLRFMFEHVSSKEGVEWVLNAPPNVRATITPHHLLLTRDDTENNVHHLCMPRLKTYADQDALWDVVLRSNRKFVYGSDTAPWLLAAKLAKKPANGIFNALGGPEMLLERAQQLLGSYELAVHVLEPFTSQFGAESYELPLNTNQVEFELKRWIIPHECHGIVPMCAGRQVSVRLVGRVK